MRFAASFLVALAGFTAGCGKTTPGTPSDTGDGAASDKDRLQGVWSFESFEAGDPRDAPRPGELETARFIFDGDKLRMVVGGDEGEKSSFVLDTASNPKVMIVTELDDEGKPLRKFAPGGGEGEVRRQEWIYKFDGEALVMAVSDGPESRRPTEFKPQAGSGTRATKRTPGDGYAPPVDVIRLKKTNEPIPAEKPRPKFGVTKR